VARGKSQSLEKEGRAFSNSGKKNEIKKGKNSLKKLMKENNDGARNSLTRQVTRKRQRDSEKKRKEKRY